MPEEQMLEVMENPEYAVRLKYEAERRAADAAEQQKSYKDQCKYQCRMTALEIANRASHPDFDQLIVSAEKLYNWLIKDL